MVLFSVECLLRFLNDAQLVSGIWASRIFHSIENNQISKIYADSNLEFIWYISNILFVAFWCSRISTNFGPIRNNTKSGFDLVFCFISSLRFKRKCKILLSTFCDFVIYWFIINVNVLNRVLITNESIKRIKN